jgi:hypothetical protein
LKQRIRCAKRQKCQARADRIAFLAQHLNFTPPPPAVIEAIPQTK